MGAQISAEEKSILHILTKILEKRGIKYEEKAICTLLLWCKRNGVPADALSAFNLETWREAGNTLFEAATRGDTIAASSFTTWQQIQESPKQLKSDWTAAVAAVDVTLLTGSDFRTDHLVRRGRCGRQASQHRPVSSVQPPRSSKTLMRSRPWEKDQKLPSCAK
ncbi:unnamed protein product, partial [Bubo scandiacus]